MSKLAVILVRGRIGLKSEVKFTLDLLRLGRKFRCVIVKDTPEVKGMLQKVKDYVTWGEVSEDTLKEMQVREQKDQKGRSHYPLHPPRGGFERKGTKRPFTLGGALGNRKEAINVLIKKML